MKYDVICYYRKDLDQYSVPTFVPSLLYGVDEVSQMLAEKARAVCNGADLKDHKSDLDLVPFLELVKVATYDSDEFKFKKTKLTRVKLYSETTGLKEVYDNYVRKMADKTADAQNAE